MLGHVRIGQLGPLLKMIGEATQILSPFDRARHVCERLLVIFDADLVGYALDTERGDQLAQQARAPWIVTGDSQIVNLLGSTVQLRAGLSRQVELPSRVSALTITAVVDQPLSQSEDRTSAVLERQVEAAGLCGSVLSPRDVEKLTGGHVLGLYRRHRRSAFDDADRHLLDVLCAHRKLYGSSPTSNAFGAQASQLPARARQTLTLLLDGLGDKEIAAKLNVSTHTVNGYTKAIYQAFSVSGRTALLAKALRSQQRDYGTAL